MSMSSTGDTYLNDKACVEFISQIAGCITYCDGSTDNSTSEKEVIMVSVLDDFQPKVCYIKLVEPPNTKADGTVAAIDAAFDEFEMPDYKNKTIGFCSDGAS
ncbi:hypothetical protein MAR_018904 [Mya arenaria]|uniref:Uncharacterized protein n=1 Tax=Mya arenaria TaxID=6604 RepID=A0ABY7EJH3_MYAAR|nr:hypothetical protein MAR_018901 [Mya arenaria]WAR08946.1 hypothetical protein MAR_018904 [Mya arenaria]